MVERAKFELSSDFVSRRYRLLCWAYAFRTGDAGRTFQRLSRPHRS
jgi:hypothetical protein